MAMGYKDNRDGTPLAAIDVISDGTYGEFDYSATPGIVHGWIACNVGASFVFLRLFATPGPIVWGTDLANIVVPIPPMSTVSQTIERGVDFHDGLSIGFTGGITRTDTTTVAADQAYATILISTF